jgi:uncharacterized protein with PIN domain
MHFLLDGMLGKLARWLRMLGYEATYQNDRSDPDLLSIAKRDSLILLTSDEELYRTATIRGIESFLVQGLTEAERLANLADRYKLNLAIDTRNSRCPVCGSPLKEKPKSEVESAVPPATFKVYPTFWVCTNPNCAKVYWQGSHWKKIEQTLEAATKILESKANSPTGREPANARRRQTTRPNSTPSSHKIP